MNSVSDILPRILKFITGESERICRLCLSSFENNGVCLEDVIKLKNYHLEKSISYLDMLANVINEKFENEVPCTICTECAENLINSYLFLQQCQYSKTVWNDALDTINKSIDSTNFISTGIKTVYLIINNGDKSILTSRHSLSEKNKSTVVTSLNKKIKRRKTTKNKKEVMCEECGMKLASNSLLAHVKNVHGARKYPCKHCDKAFPSQLQLDDHTQRIHDPKKLKCPKCPKMFANQKILNCHDRTHHTAAICKTCLIQFPSRAALRRHKDNHKDGLSKCPRCDKQLLSKQSLRLHIKICEETDKLPKFFCDLCDKAYIRKNGIRGHMAAVHGFGKAHKCEWCDKTFDVSSKLKLHILKHTKEKKFHCEQCGGRFVTQESLMYHVRLHTGEKPYPCNECGERFLSTSRRMEHIRRKHMGPTKECTICSSKFTTKHELRKHMARHRNPQSKLFVPEITD